MAEGPHPGMHALLPSSAILWEHFVQHWRCKINMHFTGQRSTRMASTSPMVTLSFVVLYCASMKTSLEHQYTCLGWLLMNVP